WCRPSGYWSARPARGLPWAAGSSPAAAATGERSSPRLLTAAAACGAGRLSSPGRASLLTALWLPSDHGWLRVMPHRHNAMVLRGRWISLPSRSVMRYTPHEVGAVRIRRDDCAVILAGGGAGGQPASGAAQHSGEC